MVVVRAVTLPAFNFQLSAPSHHTEAGTGDVDIIDALDSLDSFLSTRDSFLFFLWLLHVVYERRVGTRTSLQDSNLWE